MLTRVEDRSSLFLSEKKSLEILELSFGVFGERNCESDMIITIEAADNNKKKKKNKLRIHRRRTKIITNHHAPPPSEEMIRTENHHYHNHSPVSY